MSNFSAYRWSVQACSIFLGLLFWTAGMSKLFYKNAFIGIMGPQWLIERLAQYDLGLYATFIAYSQVLIGFMLLTLRFRLAGAMMLVPMLANILMITVSLKWQGTPYVVSVFIGMNMWLLWYDRQKLLLFLGYAPQMIPAQTIPAQTIPAQTIPTQTLRKTDTVWLLGLLLVMASISLSFISLPIAYVFAVVGVGVGWGAYKWYLNVSKQ
jgi:hypothetical protein